MLNIVHKFNILHISLCTLYTVAIEHNICALSALVLFLITPDVLNTSVCPCKSSSPSNFDWGRPAFLVWQGVALENACTNNSGIMFYLALHHHKAFLPPRFKCLICSKVACIQYIACLPCIKQYVPLQWCWGLNWLAMKLQRQIMNIQMIKVSVMRDNSHNQ